MMTEDGTTTQNRRDRGILNFLKVNILKCFKWSVATHGCDAQALRKEEEKKINAADILVYLRLFRDQWKEREQTNAILRNCQ